MRKNIFHLLCALLLCSLCSASERTYNNPIIAGYYPDPSVCRVGDDYYLVTSTFEFFPGVPIFHSKDLVNWRQIGHILDRPSQLDLDDIPYSGGIYAPTIRYNNGTFYMITTLVGSSKKQVRGNFYVTAKNPAGPWSDPIVLDGAPGIDPSLFFDDNGSVYYTGNMVPDLGEKYPHHRQIWLQQVDTKLGKLIGERTVLLAEGGALHYANSTEAPHLYKKDGYYYLITAEGGTGENHAVSVFRSKELRGPYEGHKKNPILTNRHMGRDYPIQCIGHADFVQTQNGEWWAVALGCRPYGGFYFNLARETFLVPMTWERGWPVCAPGVGHVALSHKAPDLPEYRVEPRPETESFDGDKLAFEWNFLRTPRGDFYSLTDRKGHLRLKLKPEQLSQTVNPAFVGRRQQHINFTAWSAMEFVPATKDESAGLVVYQSPDYQYRLEVMGVGRSKSLVLTERKAGVERVVSTIPVADKKLYLRVSAVGQDYTFFYGRDPKEWHKVATVDGRILNRNSAGGFTGIYIAMYASSKGTKSTNHADFDEFLYRGE